jgi:hypothetical protein
MDLVLRNRKKNDGEILPAEYALKDSVKIYARRTTVLLLVALLNLLLLGLVLLLQMFLKHPLE